MLSAVCVCHTHPCTPTPAQVVGCLDEYHTLLRSPANIKRRLTLTMSHTVSEGQDSQSWCVKNRHLYTYICTHMYVHVNMFCVFTVVHVLSGNVLYGLQFVTGTLQQ